MEQLKIVIRVAADPRKADEDRLMDLYYIHKTLLSENQNAFLHKGDSSLILDVFLGKKKVSFNNGRNKKTHRYLIPESLSDYPGTNLYLDFKTRSSLEAVQTMVDATGNIICSDSSYFDEKGGKEYFMDNYFISFSKIWEENLRVIDEDNYEDEIIDQRFLFFKVETSFLPESEEFKIKVYGYDVYFDEGWVYRLGEFIGEEITCIDSKGGLKIRVACAHHRLWRGIEESITEAYTIWALYNPQILFKKPVEKSR